MYRPLTPSGPQRRPRSVLALPAGTAILLVALLTGVALATSSTLQVAGNAKVTSSATGTSKREAIVVSARGFAVYELSGETARRPLCTRTNGCFGFWPPVRAAAGKKSTKDSRIKGKLGVVNREGLRQLTLSGHPLYTFARDKRKRAASGEGIKSFGGTWHVVKAGAASKKRTSTTGSPPAMTTPAQTTTTTTQPGYPYP